MSETVSLVSVQQMWNSGFSGDVRDAHKDARHILEEAVANMHTVMSFSGGMKILGLFHDELKTPLRRSLIRGQIYGCLYGAAQFFLFACSALVLYYCSVLIKGQEVSDFRDLLKAFLVFTFTTFILVEAFGLGPVIMRRRKSVAPVFSILERSSTMGTDEEGLKPPFIAGRIEFRHVEFRYVWLYQEISLDCYIFTWIAILLKKKISELTLVAF